MKIAVVYATKTGTTEKAAQRLAQLLSARGAQPTLYNLKTANPDLAAADAVALGGSVRMGRLHKLAAAFAKKHETELLKKPLALFIFRMGKDDLHLLLSTQIGAALVAHSGFADGVGGEMELKNQRGLDRFVVRMIQKSGKNEDFATDGLSEAALAACANALCPEPAL